MGELILGRRLGQSIFIGDIEVCVDTIGLSRAGISIVAPQNLIVHRGELFYPNQAGSFEDFSSYLEFFSRKALFNNGGRIILVRHSDPADKYLHRHELVFSNYGGSIFGTVRLYDSKISLIDGNYEAKLGFDFPRSIPIRRDDIRTKKNPKRTSY